MDEEQRENQTHVTLFILLGFQNLEHLWILPFLVFLFTYIFTMTGNLLIFVLVVIDQNLHTPMYFFLCNLACLEICYSSTLNPILLTTLLMDGKAISFSNCFLQLFFFGYCLGAECYLLSVMSYDRYLAICKPLHYAIVMNTRKCVQLAAISWTNGCIGISVIITAMLQLKYCGPNEIDHYFCDSVPLKELSCSDTYLVEHVNLILLFIYTMPPFLITLASYVYIVTAILRIPSTTGRKKAFSTCSSHLIVVSIYYGSLITVYLLPPSSSMNKLCSLLYTILPPLVNPLIYSLRNKDVKKALRRVKNKVAIFNVIQNMLRSLVNVKNK
ncbi:olfactory receptor 1009-like [Crotalus tigris]|uniref:olfactory receptor 1009-like n=1 Tax=Crotalus tigris TaxID=88082 RepID=UPI00192F7B77|nr:olfactory receptor 1009-like [Crotalus tigris]XP_039225363.1 olfactory receptor 1009-like [Crotalus tigris]